jgi:seryl-tRNA synthetase
MEIGTVLKRQKTEQQPYGQKVMDKAIEFGWIKPFAPGQFIYTAEWTKLFRILQNGLLERGKNKLGFQEWIFPRKIPKAALDSFKLTQFTPDLLVKSDSNGNDFLDPVQCVSLYHVLRNTVIETKELPLKIIECLGGWTWRNEDQQSLDGPYRAVEFARVEHVYIGSPEQVTKTRSEVQASLTEFLTELGLSWVVVVGNGCMDIPSITNTRQNAVVPDQVPVQDIEIPIRGALKPDLKRSANFPMESHYFYNDGELVAEENNAFYCDTDEICGCSVEGDHLVNDFNIRSSDNDQIWSGCCGIGMNRLLVGFLYQHGFEKSNWPDNVSAKY